MYSSLTLCELSNTSLPEKCLIRAFRTSEIAFCFWTHFLDETDGTAFKFWFWRVIGTVEKCYTFQNSNHHVFLLFSIHNTFADIVRHFFLEQTEKPQTNQFRRFVLEILQHLHLKEHLITNLFEFLTKDLHMIFIPVHVATLRFVADLKILLVLCRDHHHSCLMQVVFSYLCK